MIVVAIDTGGTKIAGAAVNEDGTILHKVSYPNSGRSGQFILDTYVQIVEELQKEFQISAIGIGAGGRIDTSVGKLVFATAMYQDYIGLPIGTIMKEQCGLPVAVDNDCRVAIYGERWKGVAGKFDDTFGIILGTGVGGGYVLNGKPVYGSGLGAGEVGHMILHPTGKACLCGQVGCAEQYLSGTALWQSYNKKAKGTTISSGYELFQLFRSKDIVAQNIVKNFTTDLAICAVSISNLLSPKAILIGGGLADTADDWWADFEREYEKRGNKHCKNTKLLRASTGNNAALLGAAWIAFERLRKRG